jgi:hypothetical protein
MEPKPQAKNSGESHGRKSGENRKSKRTAGVY